MGSPSRASGRRRLLPLALVAAGAFALLAVLGLTGADGGWGGFWRRSASEDPAGEDLLAQAPAAVAPAAGPTLHAADGAMPRETHGPVTVTVTDRQGAPVEGLAVLALVTEPAREDGIQESLTQTALTDAFGRARLDDLPYDGHATVVARARVGHEVLEPDALVARLIARNVNVADVRLVELTGEAMPFADAAPVEEADARPRVVSTLPDLGRIRYLRPLSGMDLAEARVTGPALTLTIDRGLPLRLDVREGGEGRLRPDARWQVRPRLAWADDAYGATTLPIERGKPATVTCRVEAPRGLVARREAEWTTTIHPLAERLEAVYPLRPAIDVILVVPPEGMPYRAEDWEGNVTVAGITLEKPDLHVDAQGRLHVAGGAHIVGDKVEVNGTLAKRFQATGEGYIGADAREAVVVPLALVELAPGAAAPEDPLVAFDWSEMRVVTGEGVRLNVVGCSPPELRVVSLGVEDVLARGFTWLRAQNAAPPTPAPLTVRVVAWHGGPAAGALLRLGTQERVADAQGRATFLDVPDGSVTIVVLGAGAAITTTLEVGPRPRPEALLAAQAGGTLEIEVLDTDGRPLPYAHVEVTQPDALPSMDCVDGVQRLDPYTDALGRRTLRFVTPGAVRVRATFGTRSVDRHILLLDGATEPVRLELPVLAPPPSRDG